MLGMQGNGLWELLKASDFLTIVVLSALLILSACCWAIFLYKWIIITYREKHLKMVADRMADVHHLNDLYIVHGVDSNEGIGLILGAALNYRTQIEGDHIAQEVELFQGAVEQALENTIQKEYEYLGIISASADISPLLGLFGTVWGLIHAFMRMAEKQSADIVTVAPGVAEALITTLAGLLVAIPALLMFHTLHMRVRSLEIQYSQLTEKIVWLYQRTILNKGQVYEVKKTSTSPDTFAV